MDTHTNTMMRPELQPIASIIRQSCSSLFIAVDGGLTSPADHYQYHIIIASATLCIINTTSPNSIQSTEWFNLDMTPTLTRVIYLQKMIGASETSINTTKTLALILGMENLPAN